MTGLMTTIENEMDENCEIIMSLLFNQTNNPIIWQAKLIKHNTNPKWANNSDYFEYFGPIDNCKS